MSTKSKMSRMSETSEASETSETCPCWAPSWFLCPPLVRQFNPRAHPMAIGKNMLVMCYYFVLDLIRGLSLTKTCLVLLRSYINNV